MAIYQIGYTDAGSNPRTIDLLPGDDGVQIEWRTEVNRNVTSTGIYENVVQNTLRHVTFDTYFREDAFHQLETFMSFAQQGQPFSFTKDTTKGSEVLLLAATVGDTVLTVDDGLADGFEADDYIIVRQAEGLYWDVVKVESIDADEVTVSPAIHHGYDIGTAIDWYYYFPSLYLLDEEFNPDRDGAFWHHEFNCVEVR